MSGGGAAGRGCGPQPGSPRCSGARRPFGTEQRPGMSEETGRRRAPRSRGGRGSFVPGRGAWSAGPAAGPRRELAERRGSACPARCVRARTLARACFLTCLSYSYPSSALRGQRGASGGRHGGGKERGCGDGVEVAGLALSPARPDVCEPHARGWSRGGRPGWQAGVRFSCLMLQLPRPLFLAGSREGEARGLDQIHAKCTNVAGRGWEGGAGQSKAG